SWEGWVMQEPDDRPTYPDARRHLLALEKLLQETAATHQEGKMLLPLGGEMVKIEEGCEGLSVAPGFPFKWNDLPRIEDLCQQAGIKLEEIFDSMNFDLPERGDGHYPAGFEGWYHIDAGVRRLAASSTPGVGGASKDSFVFRLVGEYWE